MALSLQIALGVDGGHAAGAGGGDGLAVDVVLDVATGEDPRRPMSWLPSWVTM